MERSEYIRMCQKASFRMDWAGAWWSVHWNEDELVLWKGSRYLPVDYRFGFVKGQATHLAILHDLKANAEYTVRLEEVKANRNGVQPANG